MDHIDFLYQNFARHLRPHATEAVPVTGACPITNSTAYPVVQSNDTIVAEPLLPLFQNHTIDGKPRRLDDKDHAVIAATGVYINREMDDVTAKFVTTADMAYRTVARIVSEDLVFAPPYVFIVFAKSQEKVLRDVRVTLDPNVLEVNGKINLRVDGQKQDLFGSIRLVLLRTLLGLTNNANDAATAALLFSNRANWQKRHRTWYEGLTQVYKAQQIAEMDECVGEMTTAEILALQCLVKHEAMVAKQQQNDQSQDDLALAAE